MVDPISIIGAAGAVANIVDLVGKTISAIYQLRQEWKEADLMLLNLTAQLTALRGALANIKEWIDGDFENTYYQVVMDLDASVACCEILLAKIDAVLATLHKTPDETLDFASKLKLVSGSKTIKDVQDMIQNQTSALTLLLTVLNSKTLAEQKALLKKSSSRRTFRRLESDSKSLVVHYDAASILSIQTDNLSKISRIFDFDQELFSTKIYERVFRGSVKATLRRQQATTSAMMQSSQSSDPWLPPRRVLLLGISESGKSTVAKQLQILYNNGFSTEALDHHRRVVFQNIGLILREIVEIMEEHGIEPVQKDNRDIWEWFKAEVSNQPLEPQLGPKLVIAVKSFWKDQCMEKIFSLSNDFCMPCFAPYFIEQIDRIASQDYVPTLLDILKARVKTTGLHESRFQVGLREWHVIDAGGSRSERKKWTHGFERDASIIFVVNLAEYDSYMFEMTHRLQETLTLFESLANLHWFTHSKIILLFTNIDLFKKKLRTIPLSDYCGDCDGGVDATKVLRYLLWRLHCLNHANCRLYPFVAEATDTPRMKTFFEAVADILADDSPSDNPTQLQDEIGKEDSVDELISAAGRFWSGDQHWVS